MVYQIEELKKILIPILKKYNIQHASIFGSYAKDLQNEKSDVDLVVEPAVGMDLIDFVDVKLELQENLSKKIDLLTYKSIKPFIKDEILNSKIDIL